MSRIPAVSVIGAGSWGTALAMMMARKGRTVYLHARHEMQANQLEEARENRTYLPGIRFPDSLSIRAGMQGLEASSGVVVALPFQAADEQLPEVAAAGSNGPVIAACKGLHPQTLERVDELFSRHLGRERMALLSGPSFAREVAEGMPTATTMAAYDEALAVEAASLFDDTGFRIYTSTDVVGVALGGALKNVIAIAAGIADGLRLGHNASAALITRGLAETSRLAETCGATRETLNGLSGLGDLVLTCTGDLSRNRRMGQGLARGLDVDAVKVEIGQTVEGLRTAAAARELAHRHGIEVPIIDVVCAVIDGDMTPAGAVQYLLSRPEKAEQG